VPAFQLTIHPTRVYHPGLPAGIGTITTVAAYMGVPADKVKVIGRDVVAASEQRSTVYPEYCMTGCRRARLGER